jgi:hypothetical protein
MPAAVTYNWREPRVPGMPSKAGPPYRVEVDVSVDDEYVDRFGFGEHGGQRRQLPFIEPARGVVGDLVEPGCHLLADRSEPRFAAHHERGVAPSGCGVVNVGRPEPRRHGHRIERGAWNTGGRDIGHMPGWTGAD